MKPFTSRAAMPLVLFSIIVAPLAACGEKAETSAGTAVAPSSRTLAETLGADGELSSLKNVVETSGLETVLAGTGPYTVFAPTNAALTANSAGEELADDALRAQGVALVRAHIVPGALTRADIGAAIDAAGGEGVEMRTMAGNQLTFTRNGQAIVVTAADGASGKLVQEEGVASNGVVQPVDGVLVRPSA